MRVTDKMIFDRAPAETGQAQGRLQDAVNENASGLKLEHAWDDPGGVAPVVAHRLAVKRFQAIEKVAGRTVRRAGRGRQRPGRRRRGADPRTRAGGAAVEPHLLGRGPAERRRGGPPAGPARDRSAEHPGGQPLHLRRQPGRRPALPGRRHLRRRHRRPAGGGVPGRAAGRLHPGRRAWPRGSAAASTSWTRSATCPTALSTNDVAAVRGSLDTLDSSITQVSVGRAQTGAVMNTLDVAVASAAPGRQPGAGQHRRPSPRPTCSSRPPTSRSPSARWRRPSPPRCVAST